MSWKDAEQKKENAMLQQDADYWERCWREEEPERLAGFLASWQGAWPELAKLFQSHDVRTVCDAACGFGACSLLFASHGFETSGFDFSPAAVTLAGTLLARYGIDPSRYRIADLLNTGFSDGSFDAAVARGVLDHLPPADASRAVEELLRIIRPGGLLLLTFDPLEEADETQPHTVLEDGSFLYTEGSSCEGMLFYWYSDEALTGFLLGRRILYRQTLARGERLIVLQKPGEMQDACNRL